MFHFKIRLISISLQFLYKIDLQTSHVYIHSAPSLLKLEGLGPVCRASGSYKRPRKRVLGQGWAWSASNGCEGLWVGVKRLR